MKWSIRFAQTFLFIGVVTLQIISVNNTQAQEGHEGLSDVCKDRFSSNGAMPGAPNCITLAITAGADLGNYFCTASLENAEAYCGQQPEECAVGEVLDIDTGECIKEACPDGAERDANGQCPMEETCPDGSLPDANGQCPQEEETCPDGSLPDANGQCPMDETCPDGSLPDANGQCPMDETCPDGSLPDANGQCPMEETCPDGSIVPDNGVCPVIDENRGTDGGCLYGLANFDTGQCPGPKKLDEFDELVQTDGGSGGCNSTDTGNPLISRPGPVLVTSGGGLSTVAAVSIANAAATGVNLTDSIVEAQETGDSSRMFDNIYNLVLPLLPGDNAVRDAFDNFSGFIDGTLGCQ